MTPKPQPVAEGTPDPAAAGPGSDDTGPQPGPGPHANGPQDAAAGGEPAFIDLDRVEKTQLAGEGNYLWKVPFRGGFAVVKVYFGSRNPLLYWKKTVGNVLLTGRSSHMPRARCRTERESIRRWESHGFRCFPLLPEVVVARTPEDGVMVFGWVPGKHFRDYFRDDSVPLDERMATWRRWLPEWNRRHRIAVDTSDNFLIHENGDVKHVMLWQDGFTYFDFEMVYTSKTVRTLVGREILAYMRSCGRFFGDAIYERMMDELVLHYPDKALLMSGWECAFADPNPLMRFARRFDRVLKPANRKRYSKYNVARDLKRRLDAASLTRSL